MTTSLISPFDLAEEVGEIEVACECVHCAPHRYGTECGCDRPAKWLVTIHHMCGIPRGDDVGCGVVMALCTPCVEAAKGWAAEAASAVGLGNGGRCFYCDAGPIRCIDDMLSVVAL